MKVKTLRTKGCIRLLIFCIRALILIFCLYFIDVLLTYMKNSVCLRLFAVRHKYIFTNSIVFKIG